MKTYLFRFYGIRPFLGDYFYALDKIALHSWKLLCVERRFELPDISNPGTPPVAGSGDLPMPVDEPHGEGNPDGRLIPFVLKSARGSRSVIRRAAVVLRRSSRIIGFKEEP